MKRSTQMPKLINVIILFLLIASLQGCKVSYLIDYKTYLDGAPDQSLSYTDSLVKISFDPKPNGIAFDIENLTKNNLFLVWDKSYFIEPDGKSSKALNTDILETTREIRDKENYESVIPQKAHFNRFTSSATRVSQFGFYNSLTIYNELNKSIHSYSGYSKFYRTGSYWYLGSDKEYSTKDEIQRLDKSEISYVQNYIKKNDNLAVGFTIKIRDKEIEYHFKFPINEVKIYKKLPSTDVFVESYNLKKSDEFKPLAVSTK